MAVKSARRFEAKAPRSSVVGNTDLMLEGHDLLNPPAVGSWTPSVDICQSAGRILVLVELPGVDASEISLSYQGKSLWLRGMKREKPRSRKLLCYYCLERRYGRFDRHIAVEGVVNPRQSRAHLENGILTIELPKLKDRRGDEVEIQIKKK